jgi:molecular chaperone HscB
VPLEPAPPGEDLFAALGLPRRFALDLAELEERYRQRARMFHPDRFARATPRERRIALDRSARLNEAHRTLAPPRRRAAYLLELLAAGDEPPGGVLPAQATLFDQELLEDQLALRERIEAASAAADAAELSRLAEGISRRLAAVDAGLAELLAPDPPPSEARRTAARLLAEARLLERALEAATTPP